MLIPRGHSFGRCFAPYTGKIHTAIGGLGHGLINWCCEWRCPLYPSKQTILRAGADVRKRPKADIQWNYVIQRLGAEKSVFGTASLLRRGEGFDDTKIIRPERVPGLNFSSPVEDDTFVVVNHDHYP